MPTPSAPNLVPAISSGTAFDALQFAGVPETATPLALPEFYSLAVSDALGWIVIGTFVLAAVLEWRGVLGLARYVAAAGWALFGAFWLWVAPHFFYGVQSPLETALSLAAVPLCVYTGYLLLSGRNSLFVLSRAVAFMGVIYLPVETIPFARAWLIETTAAQTHFVMDLVAEAPPLVEGSNGYVSKFGFDPDETATGRTTYIVLACTGIGSMSIFGGLIAAVAAPLRRKVAGFALAVGVIWILNLFRNVFVGLATPHGWFQYGPLVHVTTTYMGATPERTSFLASHTYIAQPLSVIALIGITYLVIKIVPEVMDPLEEALFVVTGTEYDLAAALEGAPDPDAAADGDAGTESDESAPAAGDGTDSVRADGGGDP